MLTQSDFHLHTLNIPPVSGENTFKLWVPIYFPKKYKINLHEHKAGIITLRDTVDEIAALFDLDSIRI